MHQTGFIYKFISYFEITGEESGYQGRNMFIYVTLLYWSIMQKHVVKNVGHMETRVQARKPYVNVLFLLFDVFIKGLCFEIHFFNIT